MAGSVTGQGASISLDSQLSGCPSLCLGRTPLQLAEGTTAVLTPFGLFLPRFAAMLDLLFLLKSGQDVTTFDCRNFF